MLYDLGPRARHVYQALLGRVRSGDLAPGARLPAHTELATTFAVAPLTVRQVLAHLEAEGVLVRERGRGTFVRAPHGPYVLIVVADPARRPAVERQVRTAGKRWVVAATPAEALATLGREGRPSLVVVDIDLPSPSAGLRLVRRLRQHEPELRIAVLSTTRGQRTRLEHSVAPPLLLVADSSLDQLSRVLGTDLAEHGSPPEAHSILEQRLPALFERYAALQLTGERSAARALLLQDGLAAGVSVADLYRSVLQPAQYRVGELWQANQIGVAREHLATAVTQALVVDLAAAAPHARDRHAPRMIVACVQGELHDIGARMVADLLELDGFGVRFLGADVPTDSLLLILHEESAAVLVLSATMPERLVDLRSAVDRVRETQGAHLRIFVGGQIMNWMPEAVRALNVDLAASDAVETLTAARRLLSQPDLRRTAVGLE